MSFFLRAMRAALWITVLAAMAGCVIVPQNRRRYLADPTMQAEDSELEARAKRKQHTSREGAGGGDGKSAGGGCGCGN